MGNFEILSQMSAENKDILLAPLSNIVSAQSGSGVYGKVTIAVPNSVIQHLAVSDGYYVGGLILANAEQFNKIKNAGDENVS